MTINTVSRIDDLIKVNHILISVSDKTGLENFIPRLIEINSDLVIYSTGGTYSKLKDILNQKASKHLVPVSTYTGQPETQGGLVKTLDFKIYLGLLTETYNDAHQRDLARTQAVTIDMVVVNLYPFKQTIAKPDTTPEIARGNIDIGGPCMIRAAAKNFLRVASVVDPGDYSDILDELKSNNARTTFKRRFELAGKAFRHTADYDRMIAEYWADMDFDLTKSCYSFQPN